MEILPLLLVLTWGAWAQKVTYNYDRTADFSAYRTYAFAPKAPPANPLLDQEIQRAVEQQLAQEGLVRVERNPQLLVKYTYHVTEQPEYQTYTTGGGWGYGWGWGWGGPGWATTTVTLIPYYTLTIDLYDAATNRLIWQAAATKKIDTDASPKEREKHLAKAMRKMFKHYPVVEQAD